MNHNSIEVEELSKVFKNSKKDHSIKAVDTVSFSVGEGKIEFRG